MGKFNLIAAFCILCCGLSAKTVTTVKTELKSGEEKSFTLDETGGVSFSNRSMLIQKNGTDEIQKIDLKDVEKLSFSNVEVSDVNQISDERLSVYPNPVAEILMVEVDGTEDVLIFSADGRVMLSQKVSQKGEIDVRGLAAGIYWVKIGGSTLKIEKL
ncbi:MAG: T9SS type A sorting domain-containing protein [Paludibacteraceae bacterium]|nr:T9SS type A sorting domain-containing protein [Paludibacteraceae bacterium]